MRNSTKVLRTSDKKRGTTENKHWRNVVKDDWKYFSQMKESDALEYLFDISKQVQANLTVLKSPDIEQTLSEFAKKNKVNIIVMGESKEKEAQQNMIKRLKGKIQTDICFDIVPDEDED